MTLPTREAFTQEALANGFAEVLEHQRPPLTVVAEQNHSFAAEALAITGEMWLTINGNTRHLRVGDRFALARDRPQIERYGLSSAIYWLARRP